MSKAKPYDISKKVVWEAYQRVKANYCSSKRDVPRQALRITCGCHCIYVKFTCVPL
jgi:hypothetical protein